MRIITKTLILVSLSVVSLAEETMCFKKNHTNLETIEVVKLDGGLCSGKSSKIDMQKNGWYVKSIEMKNDYYIYIFKKEIKQEKRSKSKTDNNLMDKLKTEIIAEINNEKQKEIKVLEEKKKIGEYEKGEKYYLKKCASCHGNKGEEKIGNTTALKEISLEGFKDAMRGYKIGSYNLGNSSEMRPYSIGVSTSDIKAIHLYLKKIN